MPRINLSASFAWMLPTMPGSGLMAPPSEQEGMSPAGGGDGYWQRKHGPPSKLKMPTWPSNW